MAFGVQAEHNLELLKRNEKYKIPESWTYYTSKDFYYLYWYNFFEMLNHVNVE